MCDNPANIIDPDFEKRAERDFEFTTYDAVKDFFHVTKLRNYYIKKDFEWLTKDLGRTVEDALQLLAVKYYRSYDTIKDVIYPR
jgi:hypothetical protein